MSVLGRIHSAGITAIAVGFALFRIVLGLLIIAGCVLFAKFFFEPAAALLVVPLSIWGLIIIVTALGVFVGGPPIPSVDRNPGRETRKALRRARMLRRW